MQVDAAPAQPAHVPPLAPVADGDASEETEVSIFIQNGTEILSFHT